MSAGGIRKLFVDENCFVLEQLFNPALKYSCTSGIIPFQTPLINLQNSDIPQTASSVCCTHPPRKKVKTGSGVWNNIEYDRNGKHDRCET